MRFSKPVRIFFLHIVISLFVTLFVLVVTQDLLFEFPPLKQAELSLIDLRFRQRGTNPTINNTAKVVVVAISSETPEHLPAKYPFPMSYYARLIKNLNRAGAKVIGIDIKFDPTSDVDKTQEDEFRTAAKNAGNVVFAGAIRSEKTLYTVQKSNPNFENRFIDITTNFGIVNLTADRDEVRRRYMPAIYDDDSERLLPTFSMAVLNSYYSQSPLYTIGIEDHSFSYLNKKIPRFDSKSFLINYFGPSKTFTRVDIADVLDDKEFKTTEELTYNEDINTFDGQDGLLYDSLFADKIVLVGSTNPVDKDLFLTPLGENNVGENGGSGENAGMMYGVEIHANVIQSILDNSFVVKQPFWMTVLIVFGLSLFTFVFTEGLKAIRTKYSALIEILGVAIILAELFIIYQVSIMFFNDENFLIDMTSPSLAIVMCYVGSTVYSYVAERRQKIMIKGMFSRYVNPTIVDELVAHPEKLRLGGERKELTVFFSDIENFTQISEQLQPEALVTVLNEYLSEMTAVVLANNGTLDKYEGDAIVAFWGAPIPQTDHALNACRSGVQMQQILEILRPRWKQENKPELKVRIGINTGDVVVGNMGGANRFDYTVMGDSVNLGSRLEGANKQYRTQIMISESTYTYVKDKIFSRELDLLVVAGKTEPIRVYELIGMCDEGITYKKEQFLNFYTKALKLYRQREWNAAIGMFEKAMELYPEDYPSYIYIERSDLYRASPPPADWNGTFILRTK